MLVIGCCHTKAHREPLKASSAPVKPETRNLTRPLTTQWTRHVGRALAGPIAVLVLIPVMVCGVGLVITLASFFNQKAGVERLAAMRFREQAQLAQGEIEDALGQGEAVLTVLSNYVARHGLDFDTEDFAHVMAGQMEGRPILAFVGIGDHRGNYTGVFYEDSKSPGSRRVVTERRMQPNGKTHLRDSYINQDGLERFRDDPEFGYDPRTRPWYLDAAREKDRITSDPYPWYDAGLIGVTVADPLPDAEGSVKAVVEVDFNLNTLSRKMEQLQETHGSYLLIHTVKGELIAQPGLRQGAKRNQEGRGEVPRIEKIGHPLVVAYLEAAGLTLAPDKPLAIEQEGERFLAVSNPVDVPGDPMWRVVCIGSLDAMLRTAHDNMWKGVATALVAMLLATVFAALFARHIVATHLRASRAERAARKAQDSVREMGAYRMHRLLGEGGMGEVWLAEHRMLARPVAVKLIHSSKIKALGPGDRDRLLARFQREAKSLARLRSPHTIEIFDFGVSDNGDLFYVMELLDGLDLHQLVRQFGPQPLGRIKALLLQAARSLSEAHAQGLIHRDIKPANIYVCRRAAELDLVKVLDFGMVRFLKGSSREGSAGENGLTVDGRWEGTPTYMAPEQVEQRPNIDGRADLYALALVGYFLITGNDLFKRETPVASIMAQVKDDPPPLTQVSDRSVPAALEALLRACLAKDPADRPADLAAFAAALNAIEIPDEEAWSTEACAEWWAAIPMVDFAADLSGEGQAVALHKQAAPTSPPPSSSISGDATIVT